MSAKPSDRQPSSGRDIRVDEVGIHTGLWNAFRLKSVFQPVYRRDRGQLVPFAVEGRMLPYLDGAAVTEKFRRSVAEDELPALERLDRALHVGNLDSLGSSDFGLFESFDVRLPRSLQAVADELEALTSRMTAVDVDPPRVTFVLRGHGDVAENVLRTQVEAIRAAGIRLATDESMLFTSPERLAIVQPDVVRIAIAQVALLTDAAVLPLLKTMLGVLRNRGTRTLIAGIGKPSELELALDVGADCLQGVLLAAPGMAGTLFDLPTIDGERLRSRFGKVVPLFG